jgi:hypothetical protein
MVDTCKLSHLQFFYSINPPSINSLILYYSIVGVTTNVNAFILLNISVTSLTNE